MNSKAYRKYIRRHHRLFWDVREDAKEKLSLNAVVETILKFGHLSDVRELFDLVGIKQVSKIFYEQVTRKRINYPQRTIHFFTRYFEKHVS